MSRWADALAAFGLIILGLAAYLAGGTVALLSYIGVVCLALAAVMVWRHNGERD